ncbi:SUMF1/EgtB/PvdO family nonheme iron enzyme [Xanthomonas cucurbitae]|uniref:SUMF1/EgtB/PvdO family nonheme iron enzyme n=1 Tax=Xanthomonas cucurbitae TaxID=56453 RepID=UPI003CCD43EA
MGAGDAEPGASDNERPAHYVRFARGFALSITEVTVAEFGQFVEATGARPRHPARALGGVRRAQRQFHPPQRRGLAVRLQRRAGRAQQPGDACQRP